jgi:hypothetical protein
MLSIGSLLCTSSTSESPSGSIDRRLRRFFDWGTELSLGLDKDNEMDKSRLDLLSYPSEIRDVLSLAQRDNTVAQSSASTRWARRLIAKGMLSVRERTLLTSSGSCMLSAILINVC